MSTEEEQSLSYRLHGLVADPPAGRNLLAAVHKAHLRRRRRVAAVSTTLGVTGVVAVGALAASMLQAKSSHPGTAMTADPSTPSSPVAPTPPTTAPSAAPSPSPVESTAPAVSPVVSTTAAPTSVAVAPPTDPAALRAAPFYYTRTIDEQYGIRDEIRSWAGQHLGGRSVEEPSSRMNRPAPTPFAFETTYNDTVSWADFSSVPSAATLHDWMYGTAEQSRHFFGVDLTGTVRGDQYAFEEAAELINGTPSTAAFRLAVIAAMERVPGVVVTDGVSDEVGRTGVQLSLKAGGDVGAAGSTNEDIIDPADGRLLQGTLSDSGACHDGNVIWRGVYLESGAVPDDHTSVPATVSAPTGHIASCVLPGEQTPPGSKP